MKFTITVEKVDDFKYKITTEDEIIITTVVTDAPLKEVVSIMRGFNVRGKKGRKALKRALPVITVG